MFHSIRWRAAAKAFVIHLLVSLLVAGGVAALVFGVWYPWPYRELTGAGFLFTLLIGIDVVCGPVLTALVFNPAKPRKELLRDLGVIACLQMAALGYGLYSVAQARPVAVVFEVDRMVVVTAAEVDKRWLPEALPEMQPLRWSGAVPLRGVREPRDAEEKWQSLDWSLQGVAPSVRPHWWVDYALVVSQVQQRMLPLPALEARLDGQARMRLQSAVQALGTASESLFYLPLVSAYALDDWIMLFDAKANKVGYAPVSGFTQADAAK